MMLKKSQGQIISSILIILLILGAVVIVWQVVGRSVFRGGEEIKDLSDCLGITLAFEKAVVGIVDNVIVRRGTGGPEVVGIYILPDNEDVVYGYGNVQELGFEKFNMSSISKNEEIKAGAVLDDGVLCPAIASGKVSG